MRKCLWRSLLVGLSLAAVAGLLRGDGDKGPDAEHVTRLVKQLGDDDFAKRQAASKELEETGEPALDALRKAAVSDGDAEVRRRAKNVIQVAAERAAGKERDKLQGVWFLISREAGGRVTYYGDDDTTLTFTDDKWATRLGDKVQQAGTFMVVDALGDPTSFEWTTTEGIGSGKTSSGVFRFEGDDLTYCVTTAGSDPRPSDFTTKAGDGRWCVTWRHRRNPPNPAKPSPEAAPPAPRP
jgi:uncharacterized protein (TIGR03067 family)